MLSFTFLDFNLFRNIQIFSLPLFGPLIWKKDEKCPCHHTKLNVFFSGVRQSWVWARAALWRCRWWRRARSLRTSGPHWGRWTGRPTTACCKVEKLLLSTFPPPRTFLSSLAVNFEKSNFKIIMCCVLSDPGKYNFTPRLFHLSGASGIFRAEELQSPTRLPGLVMAMPFVQESLYSVPQPGEGTLILNTHKPLLTSPLLISSCFISPICLRI